MPSASLRLVAATAVLSLGAAGAQTHRRPSAGTAPGLPHPSAPVESKQGTAPDELQLRLAAAAKARESGDPAAVAEANRLVLATALHQIASLRSVENQNEHAIELEKASLQFENSYDAQLGLALDESKAGHYAKAIEIATQLEKERSSDPRLARIMGSSLVQEGKFQDAEPWMKKVFASDPTVENEYAYADCLIQEKTPDSRTRAEAVFRDMEHQSGPSGSLNVLFSRAYRDAGDIPAAIRELHNAIKIDPATPHAHYFLGLALLSLNEWKPTPEAETEFHKEVELHPDDYLANYMSGFLASENREYPLAEKYLVSAEKVKPTAPEPPLFLGLNAYAQNNMAEAEVQLRKAVINTGTDVSRGNYQVRRAYVDLSRILARQGKTSEADGFAAKARELQNQTMEQTQRSVAAIAGDQGGAAIVHASKQDEGSDPAEDLAAAARISPEQASASMNVSPTVRAAVQQRENVLRGVLGLAYNDLATSEAIRGDFSSALNHYEQAEQWDPALPGLDRNLGQSAFRAGNTAEAIRALSIALKQEPANAPDRAMLGIAYFDQDQYRQAADTFAPLGQQGMTDGQTGYAWAASLAHLGDNTKAAEVLTAFSNAGVRSNDVMLLIGQLWTAIQDYPKAVATFEQVLQTDPYLWKAHLYEGLAYLRWNHYPEARKQFEAELAIAPGDPEGEYHLGFLDLQENKPDQATAAFEKVVAAHPDYANAQYQLGKMELDKGDVKEAVAHLETAAKLSPNTDFIHYQLQAAYRKAGDTAQADRELAIYKQLKAVSREQAAESIPAAH